MPSQSWVQTLISAQADGTALANSTTATTILPQSAHYTIPSNFFAIGSVLRVRAWGRISTVVTTPGNITFSFMLGPTSNIAAFSSGATALNVAAQTNATWFLEMMLTCRAIGNSTNANLMGSAQWISRAALNAPAVGTTTGVGSVLLPDTAPAVGTGFDSTVANVADLFATFSVANASNSIQCHQYTLESMN
jgi:hypothetical protein